MSGGAASGNAGVVLGLVLVALLVPVVHPALLVAVPLALLLLTQPPWRPASVLVGLGLALAVLAWPARGPWTDLERGWALLLGGWFVVAATVRPTWSFFARGLAAVGATAVSALGWLAVRDGLAALDWALSRKFRGQTTDALAVWAGTFGVDSWAVRAGEGLYGIIEIQALLLPALLGLGSLAGLALAWWVYRRWVVQEPAPLGRLRDFRFSENLVWLLVAGLALVLPPLGEWTARAGWNVVAFMGALYALRGAAVLVALLGSPGPVVFVLGAVAVVLLYPVVLTATVLVGLGDSWLDLRARAKGAERT